MHLLAAGLSDTGRVRRDNQDSFAVLDADSLIAGLDGLLLVADGMGGHHGGGTASRLAVEAIGRFFARGVEVSLAGEAERLQALSGAVQAANLAIYQQSLADPHLAGMGTTCTLLVAAGPYLYAGHVGDSRAYVVHAGRARQITEDHSLVAEEVRRGLLTAEQAEHDDRRHMLLRAIGARAEVEVDTFSVAPSAGDLVILCSDGLTNMLNDDGIAALASQASDPADACARLVAAANARGGEDNVTAVVAQVLAA